MNLYLLVIYEELGDVKGNFSGLVYLVRFLFYLEKVMLIIFIGKMRYVCEIVSWLLIFECLFCVRFYNEYRGEDNVYRGYIVDSLEEIFVLIFLF